jgi:hypothetical protein
MGIFKTSDKLKERLKTISDVIFLILAWVWVWVIGWGMLR